MRASTVRASAPRSTSNRGQVRNSPVSRVNRQLAESVAVSMGRHARLVVPHVALHIYQRGNNHQDCFLRRSDYLIYLAILRDVCRTRPCALHAYCLMTNHVHLLLTPEDAGVCARMMRDLAGRYASYFNRRYGRTGTLWEGRFGSCLVDSARYVPGCYRYVERNPVKAARCQRQPRMSGQARAPRIRNTSPSRPTKPRVNAHIRTCSLSMAILWSRKEFARQPTAVTRSWVNVSRHN
jgi:REP element-mobilizing transposase RayT